MVKREFWSKRIEEAWEERPVVWLTGVRRVGKTTLARSISDTLYFDCELPRVRRVIEEDVEGFLEQAGSGRLADTHRYPCSWPKSSFRGIEMADTHIGMADTH